MALPTSPAPSPAARGSWARSWRDRGLAGLARGLAGLDVDSLWARSWPALGSLWARSWLDRGLTGLDLGSLCSCFWIGSKLSGLARALLGSILASLYSLLARWARDVSLVGSLLFFVARLARGLAGLDLG